MLFAQRSRHLLALALISICRGIFGFLTTQPIKSHTFRGEDLHYKTRLVPRNLWAASFSELPDTSGTAYLSEENVERSTSLLEDAIAFNISAASVLLDGIKDMREQKLPKETIDTYLDELLAAGPDRHLPIWARSKRLGRLSRRARLFSLRRTLDLTTPPPSEAETDKEEEEEERKQRRRRALIALLNSISNEPEQDTNATPIIVRIERKAKKASIENSSDLRSRLPEGLESPEYDIVADLKSRTSRAEVRRYKPYSVCAVSMTKPRPKESKETDAKVQMPEMKGASAFGALAGYLFGKNDQSTAMKMTTPVFTSPVVESPEDRQMEFVLPSTYWSSENFETAPQPLSGSGVTLRQKTSEDRAVLMFGGYASRKEVEKRKKELNAVLSNDENWKAIGEEMVVAQYNDPFTVPWKRLNEVSIRVEKKNK